MPQQQLNYRTPTSPPVPDKVLTGRIAIVAIGILWLIGNVLVIAPAAGDSDGFHAMAIAVFGGVAVNAVVLVLSVTGIVLVVARAASRRAVAVCWAEALLLPLVAAGGDFFVAGWLRHL